MSTAKSTWGLQRPQSSFCARIEQLRLPVLLLCAPSGHRCFIWSKSAEFTARGQSWQSAAGVATSYLSLLVCEWAASRASTLLAQPASSAAGSAGTRRPGRNSDIATCSCATVGTRGRRRVQPSRPTWTVVRAALIVGADLLLLSVAALRLLFENRRSPLHCSCSQKLFVLPLPFSRCRAASSTCLRACERTPGQRALFVWVGRHLLVLRLRTVGAICNRWNTRS